MKTYLIYGFAMAIAGALLSLALFLLGFHTVEKLQTGQWIGMCAGLAICAVVIILGTKARREEVPATEPFGYGRALGAGVMIVLFASAFGVATNLLYTQVINPGFTETLMQVQANNLEAKGLSQDKIEQIQRMSAPWMKPMAQAIMAFVMGMIVGTLIALVTSAFLKREASGEPPVAA
jgi:hypothetical protein